MRSTQLNFSSGEGYAMSLPRGIRNLTVKGFLLNIANNNSLGCVYLGGGNFSDTFQDLYFVGPAASTATCFNTDDGTSALLTLERVRIDGFGGTNGAGFWLELPTAGDQLRCVMCYDSGSATGFYVNGWFLARLENSASDNNSRFGFFIGNNETTTLSSASSENDSGLAAFFIEGGSGSVFACDECKTQSFTGTSGHYPFEFYSTFAGTATLRNLRTEATSAAYSLDVSGSPKLVSLWGGLSNLDKGLSPAATKAVQSQ